jgi:hypothetical protein
LLECLLPLLVVAFAFLVSSFVARNADVWLHLATGRLVAAGAYSFSADPFSYTTNGAYWANPSWLYDLGLYQLFNAAGGPALVVVKAALIALLAAVLLLFRRPGQSGWAPAFCTALALLVMSPRLLLQPICLSLVLLGLTLWILWRFRAAPNPTARLLLLPARPGAGRLVLDRRPDAALGRAAHAELVVARLSAGLPMQPSPLPCVHLAGRPVSDAVIRRSAT